MKTIKKATASLSERAAKALTAAYNAKSKSTSLAVFGLANTKDAMDIANMMADATGFPVSIVRDGDLTYFDVLELLDPEELKP